MNINGWSGGREAGGADTAWHGMTCSWIVYFISYVFFQAKKGISNPHISKQKKTFYYASKAKQWSLQFNGKNYITTQF